jgi:hypothetical protein
MFAPAPPLPRSAEPRNPRAQEPGVNVARLLAGAWHENQVSSSEFQVSSSRNESPKTEDLNLSEPELNEITSLLCQLGAGALAWYKIRNTSLANTSAGEQLHEVYRRQRLSALLHERDLVDVLTLFRAEGIDAILVKGWAIARRYPDPALRSYGDLDLCVAPAQFAKAQAILKGIQTLAGPFVDLHSGFGKIGVGKQLRSKPAADWEELYARSQIVYLDIPSAESRFQIPDSKFQSPRAKRQSPKSKAQSLKSKDQSRFPVRVLSDEDHLRILCLHLLRSGARRPAWLCDVAIIIDGLRSLDFGLCASFNWEVCLGRNPVHAEWVGVAIKLAHELLAADISHTPFANLELPSWLVPAVLQQWGERSELQSPKSRIQSLRALRARWDNPIRAVAAVGGQFDERSRLRYRLAELIARTPEVPDQLRRLIER